MSRGVWGKVDLNFTKINARIDGLLDGVSSQVWLPHVVVFTLLRAPTVLLCPNLFERRHNMSISNYLRPLCAISVLALSFLSLNTISSAVGQYGAFSCDYKAPSINQSEIAKILSVGNHMDDLEVCYIQCIDEYPESTVSAERLANMYYNDPRKQDMSKALNYISIAMQRGSAKGAVMYGILCMSGAAESLPPNSARAQEIFWHVISNFHLEYPGSKRILATANFFYALGLYYGEGVKDYDIMEMYFRESSDYLSADAYYWRAFLRLQGGMRMGRPVQSAKSMLRNIKNLHATEQIPDDVSTLSILRQMREVADDKFGRRSEFNSAYFDRVITLCAPILEPQSS